MSNVVAFKMVNGMEIFGKTVDGDNTTTVTLDDACAAILQQKQDGSLSLEFRPLSLLVEGGGPAKVNLQKTAIAFQYAPGEDYRNAYVTSVSGLIIPSSVK